MQEGEPLLCRDDIQIVVLLHVGCIWTHHTQVDEGIIHQGPLKSKSATVKHCCVHSFQVGPIRASSRIPTRLGILHDT